jgi:hypothetical protein
VIFTKYLVFSFFNFIILVRRCVGRRLVTALVCCPVLVGCLFGSNWQIRFDSVHIQQLMILASSTLQIRRHRYSEHFQFVVFVGFVTLVGILSLYAINVDVVSLFADSSFSAFSVFELYYSMYSINLNEWMSLLVKKKVCPPVYKNQLVLLQKEEEGRKKNKILCENFIMV